MAPTLAVLGLFFLTEECCIGDGLLFSELRLEVDCVVGHGGNASTSGVKGMNVKKQFKTLHAIPDKHVSSLLPT